MARKKKQQLILTSEAAEIFSVGAEYIQELAGKGAIVSEERGGSLFVDPQELGDYLSQKDALTNARKPDRIKDMEKQVNKTNSLVRTIGVLFSDIIDSVAELGSMIPLAEIVVTIAVFYSAGLGEVYGIEVLIGLVFAQVAALYLTAHYRDTAMSRVGEAAIFTSIFVGAINTGIAVYLALAKAKGAPLSDWAWYVPALSSGFSVLLMYLSKMFTHERSSLRTRLRQESDLAMKEMKRHAKAESDREATLARMQQLRLDMDADSLERISKKDKIKKVQDRIMEDTLIGDIMKQYHIHPNSRLAKELAELISPADTETTGEEAQPASDEQAVPRQTYRNGHSAPFR